MFAWRFPFIGRDEIVLGSANFAAVSSRRLWAAVALAVSAGLIGFAPVAVAEDVAKTTAEAHSFTAAFESIQASDLKRHAAYLADDTFEGREAGSRGGRAAGVYLGQELRRHSLAGGGSGGGYYQPFGDGFRNVLGLLEGIDPRLKQEVIIVSAHYDHVGYGAPTNSRGPIGYIHNGADDNSSGTAGLLEMIEAMVQLEPRPKRTILFAFWDAEEKGLLGSRHWVASPTVSLERVKAMINFDMIGRLNGRRLEVYGVRTAAGWCELITRHNHGLDLRLAFTWEIKPNSDHYPFLVRGIPYLMPHTGVHADYHRPSDDTERLELDGMQAVTRLGFRLVNDLANRPTVPGFRPRARVETVTAQRAVERGSPPLPARLGIAWDKKPNDELGIIVRSVAEGSAAERAGLKTGDRITQFDGQSLTDDGEFQSYILKVEKSIRLTVARLGEPTATQLDVPLNGEPVRVGIAWREDDAEPGTAILTRVVPASPAAKAGLHVNDRIYAVSGQRFSSSDEFQRLLANAQGQVDLEVGHEGEIRHAKLDLRPLREAAAKRP